MNLVNLQQNSVYQLHCTWMERAIALAAQAGARGDVPVGALVVGPDNQLVAEAENRRERDHDPTAHAEIIVLRQAGKILRSWHLNQCSLYVTLEPCPMCAGAIVLSRVSRVIYGASDPKSGAVRSVLNLLDGDASNHQASVISGILESRCRHQLQAWFSARRGTAAK